MKRILYLLAAAALLAGCSHPLTLGSGSAPTVAIDARTGNVYCAWFGADQSGKTAVVVSTLADSKNVGRVVISGETVVNRHAQAPPQVAIAADGTVYVAWTTKIEVPGRRFPASNLLIARSEDGGRTFSAPVFVNDDYAAEPAGHTFHNLAVAQDGTVYISWLDSREEGEAEQDHHGRSPDSAMAGHGTDVRLARSSDGGRTFESLIVAEKACPCCRTALHVDPSGNVYVAWRQIFGENTRDIALAHSKDGGKSFTSPVRVHADEWVIDGCPHSGPTIAVDSDRAVHVAWYTAAEGRAGLFYAISEDGGYSFGPPESVAANVPISQASLSASGHETWLAWERPLEGRIYAGRAPGSTDTSLDQMPAVNFAGSDPEIAVTANKTAITWVDEGRIRLEIIESAGPLVR